MSEKINGICENKCLKEVYSKEDADNTFINGRLFEMDLINNTTTKKDITKEFPNFINSSDECWIVSIKSKQTFATQWQDGLLGSDEFITMSTVAGIIINNANSQTEYKLLILQANDHTIKN